MAGDWMKVEKATPEKPEVFAIAAALNADPDLVFGKCFKIWRWFDDHTTNGKANAGSVSLALVNRLCGVSGFAEEMLKVGWLIVSDDGVSIPNFDRHNGQTAKQRGLTAKRVAKHQSKTNAPSVRKLTLEALPREEKRREEKSNKEIHGVTAKRPSLEEIIAYCEERGNQVSPEQFLDHYTANGWVQGRGKPIKDWQAAVRTWEKNNFTNGNGKPQKDYTP